MSRQIGLFDTCNDPPALQRLPLAGEREHPADVWLARGWLAHHDHWFDQLRHALAWEQPTIHVYGANHRVPRLSVWYGDSDAVYRYSGRTFRPHPWSRPLARLRDALSDYLSTPFNSVLANYYRNGEDGMGYHADDEPELGPEPCIASLSVGWPRRFCFKPKTGPAPRRAQCIELGEGDLLVMRGLTQAHWLHGCPKAPNGAKNRINLTFRNVK